MFDRVNLTGDAGWLETTTPPVRCHERPANDVVVGSRYGRGARPGFALTRS